MRAYAVETGSGDGALILRRHATEQGVVIDLAANEVLRIGRGGEKCAGAVDQEHGTFRLLADNCGELLIHCRLIEARTTPTTAPSALIAGNAPNRSVRGRSN